MIRYPAAKGRRYLDCPEHGCLVLLGEDGRIRSKCPHCLAEAREGEKLLQARGFRVLRNLP